MPLVILSPYESPNPSATYVIVDRDDLKAYRCGDLKGLTVHGEASSLEEARGMAADLQSGRG